MVKIRAQTCTGIAVGLKNISEVAMENLMIGIYLDAYGSKTAPKTDSVDKEGKKEADKAPDKGGTEVTEDSQGVINLRFEESFITRKASSKLAEFLRLKHILESIGFIGARFEDNIEFKKVMDAIIVNRKLTKLKFEKMIFDDEIYGKSIGKTLVENRFIRELDISFCTFEDVKSFYHICMDGILNERCRL